MDQLDAQDAVQVVDIVTCPECTQTCLQRNIYRHLIQMHQWSREDCKWLTTMIRSEKKGISQSGINTKSYLCGFCDVSFQKIRDLIKHKKMCVNAPNQQLRQQDIVDELIDFDFVEEEEPIDISQRPTSSYIPQTNRLPPSPRLHHSQPSTSTVTTYHHPPHRPINHALPTQSPVKMSTSNMARPPIKYTQYSDERAPSLSPVQHNKTSNDEDEDVDDEEEQDDEEQMNQRSDAMKINGPRYRTAQTSCPKCHFKVESCDELVAHCHEKHETFDQKFVLEEKCFKTVREFKKWFDQRQEDSCTSLTKRTGHGGETFYRCHMVGKYSSVAKKRRSNPRKLDQCCTAFLKVYTHPNGQTYACGCFNHIGHELNHKLLWLTETQEKYVKELIDMGWTSDQIFFFIREEYESYECKLKYISKNDIRNIQVRYNRAKAKAEADGTPLEPISRDDEDDEEDTSTDDPALMSYLKQKVERNQMYGKRVLVGRTQRISLNPFVPKKARVDEDEQLERKVKDEKEQEEEEVDVEGEEKEPAVKLSTEEASTRKERDAEENEAQPDGTSPERESTSANEEIIEEEVIGYEVIEANTIDGEERFMFNVQY